jgi:hypothetical protein
VEQNEAPALREQDAAQMLIEVAMNTDRLALPLHTFTRRGPARTFQVEGWTLLRDHPTIAFGDGGCLKSYLALYSAGRLSQEGKRVLLLDWELDADDHVERLHRLFNDDVPTNLYYLRCEEPLVSEVGLLRREVQRLGIDFLVCDSVGAATDGPPESAENALRYFRALRHVGVSGSLHVAHVNRSESGDQKPFGSVFWHNWARMTWFIKRERSTPGRPCIRLVSRKANLTALLSDVRLEFDFATERTAVSRLEGGEGCETVAKFEPQHTRNRILALIKSRGPLTASEIVHELPDVQSDTINRVLRRCIGQHNLVKVSGPDGKTRVSLPEGNSA